MTITLARRDDDAVLSPTLMSGTTATKLGLKQYVVGTAYTNGTITTTGPTGWTIVRGVFVPYQITDGAWRLRFNIQGTITTGSSGTQDITVSGITFVNITASTTYKLRATRTDAAGTGTASILSAGNSVTTFFATRIG
jgi:hypothetical protein